MDMPRREWRTSWILLWSLYQNILKCTEGQKIVCKKCTDCSAELAFIVQLFRVLRLPPTEFCRRESEAGVCPQVAHAIERGRSLTAKGIAAHLHSATAAAYRDMRAVFLARVVERVPC